MVLKEIKVDELVPYENNPRKNESAVEAVANSIKQFGFRVPIIIDKNNVVVAGHTRIKAAKMLGFETVPAIQADDLTEQQIKAFRLADNKTGELAGWDFIKLEEELAQIADIDMSEFGFDDNGLDDDSINEMFKVADPEGKQKDPKRIQCPHCGEWFEAE